MEAFGVIACTSQIEVAMFFLLFALNMPFNTKKEEKNRLTLLTDCYFLALSETVHEIRWLLLSLTVYKAAL